MGKVFLTLSGYSGETVHEALGQRLIEGIVVIQKYRHALEAFGGGATFFKERNGSFHRQHLLFH